MAVARAIACAWTDPDSEAKLVSAPHAAPADVGVAIPAGTTIKVIENTADTQQIVLPTVPKESGNLSME